MSGRLGLAAPLLGVLLAAPAVSQSEIASSNHARGFRPEHTFEAGAVENVDVVNGNLTLTIPIGPSYPLGPEFSYGLSLTYSGNVWIWDDTQDAEQNLYLQSEPRPGSNAGLGWRIGLGRMLPPGDPENSDPGWSYESPDQSVHDLSKNQLHPGGQIFSGLRFTQDSTYLRFDPGTRILEMPDGSRQTFDAAGRPTRIEDAFGHGVTVTYTNLDVNGDPHTWTLMDDYNRVHTVSFGLHSGRLAVDQVRVRKFGGSTALYQFVYGSASLPRPCNKPAFCGSPSHVCGKTGPVTVPVLTEVVLPGGAGSYRMPVASYESAQTGSCPGANNRDQNGLLKRLELPTGGAYEYDWQTWFFPVLSNPQTPREGGFDSPFRRAPGLAERRRMPRTGSTPLGSWQYSPELVVEADGIDRERIVTETEQPSGEVTEHFVSAYPGPSDNHPVVPAGGWTEYEYGLPFTRKVTDGAGRFLSRRIYNRNGTLVRTIYVRYERSGGKAANSRLASQRTVYHDDFGGRRADVTYSDFDGLGHYRTTQTGGNFSGENVRRTTTRFNLGRSVSNIPGPTEPWVLGTYDQTTVTEGSQTVTREYDFDGATGFLKRTRIRKAAGCGGEDVIVERMHFPMANVAAGFVSRESFYGGDGAALPCVDLKNVPLTLSGADYSRVYTYSCGALATSRWFEPGVGGVSFLTADRTIDCSSGLVAASKDVATLTTTFAYDDLGRVTSATPQGGEAQTVYIYTAETGSSPAKVATREKAPDGTIVAGGQVELDGFGQVAREVRDLPGGGQAERTSSYTAQGELFARTEWHTPGNATGTTSFGLIDPFGRPRRVDLPDGYRIDIDYDGVGVRRVSVPIATLDGQGQPLLATATTKETYDRFGRLVEVQEPNGTRTSYAYDALDDLTGVTMNVGSTPQQSRSFSYDHRGYLGIENHPELGTAILYKAYDALGNPHRIQRGIWDLDYGYDPASRLVEIRDHGTTGETGLWKQWMFAENTLEAGPWGLGKLREAVRHNRVINPANGMEFHVPVTEDYTYGGVGGRISAVTTTVGVGSQQDNTQPVYHYSLAYDLLGNVTSRTYPDCSNLYCVSKSPDRTVTATYDQGLLASVPGFASSITYHPNGLVHRVVHTNGVTDVQDNDPSDLQRPYRLRTEGAADDFDTGLFGYDGAGNVMKMGPNRFGYDLLSRLTSAEVTVTPDPCSDDRLIQFITYSGSSTVETCGAITTGSGVSVTGTGNLTFRSGDRIALGDGFHVDSGGRFVAEIDPAIEPVGGGPEATWTGKYDLFGNLTEVTSQHPGMPQKTRTMAVVATTNRLSAVPYDTSGNIISSEGRSFRYDPFNMLRETGTYVFVYGPGDERIWEIDWTAGPMFTDWVETWTLRDLDGSPLRQMSLTGGNTPSGTWTFLRDYVWRGGGLLAAVTDNGTIHFHLDHLGTPRLTTGDGGSRLAYDSYLPFGEEATNPDDSAAPLQYTGHERDNLDPAPESTTRDLDYMHARYHSPHLGRFMSVDPVLASAEPSRPQTWNRYSYVYGNPIKYLDPDGETVESALQLITANAQTILSASALSSGQVTPVEIARVLFQENMNDHNLIRGNDASAFVVGGPEVKNMGAIARFTVFGVHGSFGIAEMRTDTAARLLGWDPDNLSAEQTQKITKILSNPKGAIILLAAYIAQLKKARPNASTDVILSDYNRGLSNSDQVNSVGGRSGAYINEIVEALGRGLTAGGEIKVVRCGDEYKFSNQCGAGSE